MQPQGKSNAPPPPIEISAKYAAWNIKGIDEKMEMLFSVCQRIAIGVERIATALEKLSKSPSNVKPATADDVPF